MTISQKRIALFAGTILWAYLASALVQLSPNPLAWSDAARELFAVSPVAAVWAAMFPGV